LLRALDRRGAGGWTTTQSLPTPWSNGAYSGTAHRIAGTVDGDAERFVDGLAEQEFALGPHVLIDLTVVSREGGEVVIEALTVEAW